MSDAYRRWVDQARLGDAPLGLFLSRHLPDWWYEEYGAMTARITNVMHFRFGTFEYLYDDLATLENTGVVPIDTASESRLVAAFGFSARPERRRVDSRLRGWIGPTEERFGKEWDKGHFIAESIGGSVDGIEANVFCQLRALNRGWSASGRRYRAMERFCAANPGVFCFNRPLYDDPSAIPAQLEFGVLTPAGDLWVERFTNRA